MLISDEYKQLNAQLHANNAGYGTSGSKHIKDIWPIISQIKAASVLDYGCGKCTLGYSLRTQCGYVGELVEYDPCLPGREHKSPCDFVACTDVLEHIEPEMLLDVLDDLQAMTKKVIFLAIATRPAKKILADGRNAHLIQQQPEWWLPLIMERFRLLGFHNLGGEFIAIAEAK